MRNMHKALSAIILISSCSLSFADTNETTTTDNKYEHSVKFNIKNDSRQVRAFDPSITLENNCIFSKYYIEREKTDDKVWKKARRGGKTVEIPVQTNDPKCTDESAEITLSLIDDVQAIPLYIKNKDNGQWYCGTETDHDLKQVFDKSQMGTTSLFAVDCEVDDSKECSGESVGECEIELTIRDN